MVSDYQQFAGTAIDSRKYKINVTRNLMVLFILIVFLGFPGNLTNIIGRSVGKLIENAAFGMQFLLVLSSTGDSVMDIKLVDLKPYYWVIYLYLAYTFVDSVAVSIDRKMVITSVIHLILTAAFALWLIEQYKPTQLLEIFYVAIVFITGLSLFSIFVMPKIGTYYYQGAKTFRGLFGTKNEFGCFTCFGILVQIVLLKMRLKNKQRISYLFWGTLGAQFLMLLGSKNMGSLLVSFVAIGYMIYYGKQQKRLPLGLIFITVSVGFLFFALTVLQELGPFLESLGKDATLTGRVPLWERGITVMQERNTFTGYGYLMFWRTPSAANYFRSGFSKYSWAGQSSNSTHNLLVEMWCDSGLLGIAAYFLMIIAANRGIKYLEEEQYLFSSSFIVLYTVSTLTERGMSSGSVFTMTLFVILGMMYQAEYRHRLSRRKKAKIYEEDEEDAKRKTARGSGGDLAAFQRRFSNLAEKRSSTDAPKLLSRQIKQAEPKKNKLQSLLNEFDDEFDDNGFDDDEFDDSEYDDEFDDSEYDDDE